MGINNPSPFSLLLMFLERPKVKSFKFMTKSFSAKPSLTA